MPRCAVTGGNDDLVALLRAVPPNLPLSVEVPTRSLARTMTAADRAKRALAATRAVLTLAEAQAGNA